MRISTSAVARLALKSLSASLLLVVAATAACPAQEPIIPQFWDAKERLTKPDISSLQRLRFLTTTDFPPFNFLDSRGRLSGFHVDLARAICDVLDLADRCQIQALPWDELEGAMERGEGEAIIAGLAISAKAREKYAFSRSYLRFPARFVTLKSSTIEEPVYQGLDRQRVGVIDGTAHERMLRDYFPDVQVVTYSRSDWMFTDLREGNLAAVFGDGMRLSFWLAGAKSENCCRFAGGPYLAPEYFGYGLAIAARADHPELAAAFDYALRELNVNGKFAELYLRYFPLSFY